VFTKHDGVTDLFDIIHVAHSRVNVLPSEYVTALKIGADQLDYHSYTIAMLNSIKAVISLLGENSKSNILLYYAVFE
jgi:hypothetical protein